jgi:hypothetical protein
MNTIILDRKDIISPYKNGMLIKQWERGDVSMYTHIVNLDGKYSEIYNLEVKEVGHNRRLYNYANTDRPIVSELNVEQYINKYHGTQII